MVTLYVVSSHIVSGTDQSDVSIYISKKIKEDKQENGWISSMEMIGLLY